MTPEWEGAVLHSELIELGRETLAAVAKSVGRGAPLLYCQLLATEFYDALERELRQAGDSELSAAAARCLQAGRADISPEALVAELQDAIAVLQPESAPVAPSRPALRVIQGGLSA